MECSLSTWPSISQFDDLTWMGLGDIDPLESLDRSFNHDSQYTETSFSNLEETKPASPAAKTSVSDASSQLLQIKSDDFYRLTSAESLAAARWESINAVDLASVLDNFPSNNDSSTAGDEDVYDLYNESVRLQGEPPLSDDVDVFMSDSMSELADANHPATNSDEKSPTNDVTVISSDRTSLSGTQDVDDDSPGSVNVSGSVCGSLSQMGMKAQVMSNVQHHVDYVENSGCGSMFNSMQPSGCFSVHPTKLFRRANHSPSSHGPLDVKESIATQQHDCLQSGMVINWSSPQSTSVTTQLYDGEQVVQHSHGLVENSYPAILDQQVRMADAARVTSELKRNRAQASRARRLAASQRRAKKYPLQKLIRMSSSSAHTREKSDRNILDSAVIPHQPLQPVSINTTSQNSQLPTMLPVLLQGAGTHFASSHELLSHANGMQCPPYYQYHHSSTTPCEDNLLSPSGSSTLQSKHHSQNVQSLSTIPSLAASNTTNSTQPLDVVLLNQLRSMTDKMNVEMRFCIRDALYRLARSAKYRQNRIEGVPGSDANTSHLEAMETNTNSIDRWIANMLFCKQSTPFDANSQPYFSEAPSHEADNADTNCNLQQWNSCGSLLNPRDQRRHVLTGL